MKFILVAILLLSVHSLYGDEIKTGDESSLPDDPSSDPLAPRNFCQELKVGDSLAVDDSKDYVIPTGLKRAFKLTRKSLKKWDIEIPIAFDLGEFYAEKLDIKATAVYSGPVRKTAELTDANYLKVSKQTKESYAKFVNLCFKKMKDRIRSPDGTIINLKLKSVDADKGVPYALPHNVALEGKPIRSHSTHWSSAADCPEVIHEVSHLLGLVDTYKENKMKIEINKNGGMTSAPKFSCRKLDLQMATIMSDQHNAFEDSYEITYCGGKPGRARPSGTTAKSLRCPSPLLKTQTVVSETIMHAYKDANEGEPFFYTKAAPRPTITDEEARFLTQPSCYKSNASYIACAGDAYRTKNVEKCSEHPECKNPPEADYL